MYYNAGYRKRLAEKLLEHGCTIDAKDKRGRTPLHHACLHGQIDFAKLLLEKGASVNLCDDQNYTPLSLAASMMYSDLCTVLLENGASSMISTLVLPTGSKLLKSRIHELSLRPKRQEPDYKALQDKRKRISVFTTSKEWDEGGVHCSMNESMISEDGGQIDLSDVTLNLPPKSLEQPVLISTTKTDHDDELKQTVNLTGLEDVVKPGMKLSLKPHGQKFLQHVSLELDQKVPEGSSVLIFHKDEDPKNATEWTNITDECNLEKKDGKLILKMDQISCLHVLLVSVAVQTIAIKYCLALLNKRVAQCKFYAYFKETEEPLHVFAESMKPGDRSITKKHTPEIGYELLGDNVSSCELIDQEYLNFHYDNQDAAHLQLWLDMCHEQGQLFVLPKTSKTAYPPRRLDIKRDDPIRQLCEIPMTKSQKTIAQSEPSASQNDMPRKLGTSGKSDREILENTTTKQWTQCLKDLEWSVRANPDLVDLCWSKSVINRALYQNIQEENTSLAKSKTFVAGLCKIDKAHYLEFHQVLQENMPGLAKQMIDTLGNEVSKQQKKEKRSQSEKATAQSTQSASQNVNTSSVLETSSMKCKEILLENWTTCLDKMRNNFAKYLEVDELLDVCLSKEIITHEQLETVKVQRTNYEKGRQFCDVLRRIANYNYPIFLDELNKIRRDLADEMKKYLGIKQ